MTPSEEIMQFLKDNPTFYLATVDGYLPRVRPLGFAMWYKDHLCLGIGKHKAAYKQLLDNTNLEICACNEKGEFLRVQGTANFDNTPEAQAAAFKIMPQLEMCIRDSLLVFVGYAALQGMLGRIRRASATDVYKRQKLYI